MGAFRALTIGFFQEAFRKDIPIAPRVDLLTRMVVGSERLMVIDRYIDKHCEPAGRLLELLARACMRAHQFGNAVTRVDVVQPYHGRDDFSSHAEIRKNWAQIVHDVQRRLSQDAQLRTVSPLGLKVVVFALQATRKSECVHDRFVVGKLCSINITGGTRLVDRSPDGAIMIRPSLLPTYQWIPERLKKSESPVNEYSI